MWAPMRFAPSSTEPLSGRRTEVIRISQYRPAAGAFLLMMAMALTTTALSFFVTPVCDALVLGRGSFTVYYSLMTASGALAAPFLGQRIHKSGVRRIVAISAVWVSAALAAFSFCSRLWMFYGVGAFLGVFGTACVSLCATVIVQQAYSGDGSARILGVVMAGSGVGGMLVSLMIPLVMNAVGWRWSYRLVAVMWLILVLSAFVLLGKQTAKASGGQSPASGEGMTRAQAFRSPALYLLILVMLLLSAACGIQQQIPSVLAGYGFADSRISAMVSFFTVMLALGKIGQGMLYARIGAVKGGMAVVLIFALSFLVLPIPALVWPGLAALAVGMGSVTTLMPLLTRNVFGTREYAAIWSILSTVSNVGALAATPLFGMAYDISGSYGAAMRMTAAVLVIALVLLVICFRKRTNAPE